MSTDKLFLAIALVLTSLGLAYAYLITPTWLNVAVGPTGSADERLMRAFAEQLRSQKTSLRLRIVTVADVKAAAEKLDNGSVELAVVRPDVKLPTEGLSVAILRDAATIVLAPSETGITELSGLFGKTLGVVKGHEADPTFVRGLLRQLDIDPSEITVKPVDREAVLAALKDGSIDAVALLAPPTGSTTSDFVRSVTRAYDGRVSVLPVESPDALTQRSPIVISTTIPEGVWAARPRFPEREIRTIGVSYRLMARSDADRVTVAAVAESLFQMRSRIAPSARSANLMRAPEMDGSASATTAMLPNHPGAVDYFQRETQTVMDRYGDWIYLAAFFGSGTISACAWLVGRLRRHRREVIDDVLDRLLTILADARTAETSGRLDELSVEIDDLLRVAVGHARTGAAGARTTSALMLALEGARSAVDDRRRQIEPSAEPPRRGGGPPRLVTAS